MKIEETQSEGNSSAPRPLQNRVDPFGRFHAVAARGGFMGNRGGRLHDANQRLKTSRWTSRRWIVCVCAFKGRRREVWGAGYTELFFADEPTALAAGHRPCFECRRVAAKTFLAAFPGSPDGADAMDAVLHRERLDGTRQRVWRARLGTLPEATFVALDGRPHAIRDGVLQPWTFSGYGEAIALDPGAEVDVLTPPSTVAALARGYRPLWRAPDAQT
jgi:hypothetical protein